MCDVCGIRGNVGIYDTLLHDICDIFEMCGECGMCGKVGIYDT